MLQEMNPWKASTWPPGWDACFADYPFFTKMKVPFEQIDLGHSTQLVTHEAVYNHYHALHGNALLCRPDPGAAGTLLVTWLRRESKGNCHGVSTYRKQY